MSDHICSIFLIKPFLKSAGLKLKIYSENCFSFCAPGLGTGQSPSPQNGTHFAWVEHEECAMQSLTCARLTWWNQPRYGDKTPEGNLDETYRFDHCSHPWLLAHAAAGNDKTQWGSMARRPSLLCRWHIPIKRSTIEVARSSSATKTSRILSTHGDFSFGHRCLATIRNKQFDTRDGCRFCLQFSRVFCPCLKDRQIMVFPTGAGIKSFSPPGTYFLRPSRNQEWQACFLGMLLSKWYEPRNKNQGIQMLAQSNFFKVRPDDAITMIRATKSTEVTFLQLRLGGIAQRTRNQNGEMCCARK